MTLRSRPRLEPTCGVDCHHLAEGPGAQLVLGQHAELVLSPGLQPRHHQPDPGARHRHGVPVVGPEVDPLGPAEPGAETEGREVSQYCWSRPSHCPSRCDKPAIHQSRLDKLVIHPSRLVKLAIHQSRHIKLAIHPSTLDKLAIHPSRLD